MDDVLRTGLGGEITDEVLQWVTKTSCASRSLTAQKCLDQTSVVLGPFVSVSNPSQHPTTAGRPITPLRMPLVHLAKLPPLLARVVRGRSGAYHPAGVPSSQGRSGLRGRAGWNSRTPTGRDESLGSLCSVGRTG
jgi:hypothetical protein